MTARNFQFVLAEGKTSLEAYGNLTYALAQIFKPENLARIITVNAMPEGRPQSLATMGQPQIVLVIVACVEFEGEVNTAAVQNNIVQLGLPNAPDTNAPN